MKISLTTKKVTNSLFSLFILVILSLCLANPLMAQEGPIIADEDIAPVDADIVLAEPGDIKCGEKKPTNLEIPEIEYCTTDEDLALDSLERDMIDELEILGWDCVEPPFCPGTRVCIMKIEWPYGPPKSKKEGNKRVFKKQTKNINVKCRCGSGFTSGGSGEQTNLPFPTDEPAFVSGVFEVFPNPASDYLQVKLDDKLSLHGQQIRINGTDGKLISQIELNASDYQHQINISDLPDGIYFLSLYEGDQRIETLRFVVEQ